MNKTYRSIWNAATSTWTAVAETVKSHSKGSSRAARQAVIAIALGGASIGGAMAADACTTEDGSSGTVDAAGVCKVAGSGSIGTMGSVGTMAALDDAYIKVNSSGTAPVASALGTNSIAVGAGASVRSGSDNSIAIGTGASVASSNRYIPVNAIAIGNSARVIDSDIPGATGSIALGDSATAGGIGAIVIGSGARNGNSGTVVVGTNAYADGGGVVMGNSTYATGGGVGLGLNATATGGSSVAIGSGASASASGAVALGTNSVAGAANTVSVGSATLQRRIVNVAAGTANTDAVNVGQLNTGLSTTNASIAATNAALSTTNTTLAATNAVLATKIDDTLIKVGHLTAGDSATVSGRASNIAIGAGASSTGGVGNSGTVAIGESATASGNAGALAFGTTSRATGTSAIAVGLRANAASTNGVVVGQDSSVDANSTAGLALGYRATVQGNITGTTTTTANNSLAIGTNASVASTAAGNANNSVALGSSTRVTADGAVALGYNSVADTANTVSVGNSTTQRRIVNVDNGTADTDAVNVRQMNAGLSTTNASIAATNAALSTTNTTLAATNTALSTTNTTLAATNTALSTTNTQVGTLTADMTTAKGNIATNTADIKTINDQLADLSDGSVGLVQQSAAGADLTVGANTDGAAVNFAGTAGDRKLSGIAAGTADSDAVNVGQMNAGLATTNAAIAATNAELSTTNTTLAATNSGLSTAQDTIATHTTEIGDINNQLSELSSGTTGLVQQSAAGADLTVGANTDGAAVNFAGTAGDRKLSGIAAGTLDSDAVNVSQMNAGLATTNAAIAATNAELSTTNTSLATTNAELSTTNTTLAATNADLSTTNTTLAATNSALSTAQDTIATHTTEISDINSQLSELSSGTIGLVQQTNAGDDLTVGANTDGAAVNFAGTAGDRKLTGIAAGEVSATSAEAVNGSQLHGVADSVASAIGGGSTVNADGSISAPSFTVGDGSGGTTTVNTVAGAVSNLDGRTTTNEGDITSLGGRVTINEGAINKLAGEIGSGTVGLVQQTNAGDDLTVGANTDGAAVNFAGTAGDRKLTGIAAGDVSAASTDAVNGSQLHGVADSVASAIGGGSTVNPDGSISAPAFTVGDGSGGTTTVNTVAGAVSNLDGRTTANEGDITSLGGRVTINEGAINKLADQIGSGTVGLVQQANAGDDLTVGANTDGAAVNFAGTAGDRKLTGIAAGEVSATSAEAVNGSQLHGVADSVASAIGGGSTVNPDGSISAPSFTIGDGKGGSTTVGTVADVVSNLDDRTTANEGSISKLADELGSGTLGLVQQAGAGADLTVGANTDGAAVNFTGTAGNRKLTGIAAGDVSATSAEAVNGSQLHGVADSVASAIGGGSTVNADGSISAPSFTVGDGSGGTKIVNSVGGVVTNLNDRVTSNEGGIKNLADQLGSGTVGLVQQNPTNGTITVGAGAGGSVVNFAGSGGPRVLSGVANGVHDDDAVTISQLRATGLIDYTGKEVGAVTYDSGLSFDSVTFAGTNGTVLRQVAAGAISATSMEAINGSQLYALQEQFAKQYGDLSGQFGDLSNRFDDLAGRLGDLEEKPGTGGPGTGDGSTVVGEGAVASGENSSAIGDSSHASGDNSSAVGQGAVASGENSSAIGQGAVAKGDNSSAVGQGAVAKGDNSSAIGQGSVASGENSTAVGQGSVASGDNSTALGQGSTASGSGSVAIGQGSVATEANTVSFGDGTPDGNRRLVNIADGVNASDAATKGQLDRAMESVDQRFNDTNRAINDVAKNAYAGIAAAMAMPNMTPSQPGKTVVAVGAANFKSGSAVAAGATYRTRDGKWLVNGAASVTSVGDAGVRAQVGYEF